MRKLIVRDYYDDKLIISIILVKYNYTYWMDDIGNWHINGINIMYATKTKGININSKNLKERFILLELLDSPHNSFLRIDKNYPEDYSSTEILTGIYKYNPFFN